MRIITPRATPVVRAPAPSIPPTDLGDRPPLMRPPVSIITPVTEIELREGSLLAGRLPECDVMIDDGLVSRMHARISIRDESVLVEDLHSTNGVYVNGMRITHSALLREGDRLLLGTTEISLFEARPDARVAPLRARRDDPERSVPVLPPRITAPTTLPAQARDEFGKLELHLDELAIDPSGDGPPSARSADLQALRSRRSGMPSTARADALEVIGALADRLAASGNLDEARRLFASEAYLAGCYGRPDRTGRSVFARFTLCAVSGAVDRAIAVDRLRGRAPRRRTPRDASRNVHDLRKRRTVAR
jgi:pSer/pThr/pTyr-binding forkhead associated (FHA) protein